MRKYSFLCFLFFLPAVAFSAGTKPFLPIHPVANFIHPWGKDVVVIGQEFYVVKHGTQSLEKLKIAKLPTILSTFGKHGKQCAVGLDNRRVGLLICKSKQGTWKEIPLTSLLKSLLVRLQKEKQAELREQYKDLRAMKKQVRMLHKRPMNVKFINATDTLLLAKNPKKVSESFEKRRQKLNQKWYEYYKTLNFKINIMEQFRPILRFEGKRMLLGLPRVKRLFYNDGKKWKEVKVRPMVVTYRANAVITIAKEGGKPIDPYKVKFDIIKRFFFEASRRKVTMGGKFLYFGISHANSCTGPRYGRGLYKVDLEKNTASVIYPHSVYGLFKPTENAVWISTGSHRWFLTSSELYYLQSGKMSLIYDALGKEGWDKYKTGKAPREFPATQQTFPFKKAAFQAFSYNPKGELCAFSGQQGILCKKFKKHPARDMVPWKLLTKNWRKVNGGSLFALFSVDGKLKLAQRKMFPGSVEIRVFYVQHAWLGNDIVLRGDLGQIVLYQPSNDHIQHIKVQ